MDANQNAEVLCDVCDTYYRNRASHELSDVHRRHVLNRFEAIRPIVELQSAVRDRLKTYWVSGFEDELTDVVTFLGSIKSILSEKITQQLENAALKINVVLKCKFVKGEDSDDRSFKTENERVLQTDNVEDILHIFLQSF
jgi:hypothetical protein